MNQPIVNQNRGPPPRGAWRHRLSGAIQWWLPLATVYAANSGGFAPGPPQRGPLDCGRRLAQSAPGGDHGPSIAFAFVSSRQGVVLSEDNNVIPFRKPPPSRAELEIYRQITRNWSPALRQLLLPEHFRQEQKTGEGAP